VSEGHLLLKELEKGAKSGPELASALGISRAAVWKKIKQLRGKGFVIEAGSSGYRLLRWPELSAEGLKLLIPLKKIIYKPQIPSTNEWAIALAERGKTKTGAVIVADTQSAGKGRLGRTWASPAGLNIYMSLLTRPSIPPRKAPLISIAAAIASALAIKAQTGLSVGLKWPNDLMVKNRKLGGILLELRSDPDRILFAVIGIGINVNARRQDLPKILRDNATSVFIETGRKADRAALIAAIQKEFEHWLGLLSEQGRSKPLETILRTYRALSATIGKKVSIHAEGRVFQGTAIDIDDEGRLVLSSKNKTLRFSTGDVLLLRRE
jgi:BirA family biotin operon repressor/biotin-[acetyl-CoA-carboxylase] ligase